MAWVVGIGFGLLIIVVSHGLIKIWEVLCKIERAQSDIATWYVVERADREEEIRHGE